VLNSPHVLKSVDHNMTCAFISTNKQAMKQDHIVVPHDKGNNSCNVNFLILECQLKC